MKGWPMMTKSKLLGIVMALCIVACGSSRVDAQLVVYDAANTAQNATTAGLKELMYQLQIREHDQIIAMARRLSAFANLGRYVLTEVPRWRTHGGDFFFAQPFLEALIFGDPAGTAYMQASTPLERSERVGQLPTAALRTVLANLSQVEAADATAIAAIQASGTLRYFGRKSEIQAIDSLERDVVDPSKEQSATAVLDKISGATLVGAQQGQARIQLLTEVLEQLLTDNKQMRDAEATALNMQLVKWRDGVARNAAFVAGSGDALRSWRQP
jgi:hypothetical protein